MDLPLGDKVAAMLFIGCGLGIAYLFELQREGVQLVSFKEADNIMQIFPDNDFIHNHPFKGLHETSLNIQSLLKNGSSEIIRHKDEETEEEIDKKIFILLLDVLKEMPFSPQSDYIDSIKDIYDKEEVFKVFVNVGAEWILDDVLLALYGVP